ncbi:uncharacterized protein [Fopius arisanus]|uniref:Uncharacterized protein isoform X2 n=1 Tax=Fopius arisanus TaxID=64838 RepID=A0A9R1U8D9_9HYME|nr:PREDICTED: uncharacterized protein LOC105272036 isoform X2 [Fopius arisanus]
MAMAEGIMKRLSDIKQERQWISGEIDFLNKRVDDFKRRIQRVEAEISHLQEIQDAVSNSEDRSSNRLAGLMRERRRHLVEMQYALPSVYEELKRLVLERFQCTVIPRTRNE